MPHSIAFEPYVKAIQFKVLNSILFTNSKLFKIGYRTNNLCSFCKQESETIKHFFHDCPYSNLFWKNVELYYFVLRKQQLHLTLKDILIGILTSESSLLNYLILIGKIYLWSCRGTKVLPHSSRIPPPRTSASTRTHFRSRRRTNHRPFVIFQKAGL